jgi:3-oxoacyl-[acyl-carrier-protein] synthase II
MPQPRQVVITGLGVVSPLGIGRDAFWSALLAGTSGIDWQPETRGHDTPFRFAGRIRDFDAKQYVQPRKTIKVMCQEIQWAYAAAAMALEDAVLAKGSVEPERMGVVLGSEMLYGDLDEVVLAYRHCRGDDGQFDFSRWGEHAMKDLFPLWMLKFLPNMAACHISIACDARGPNNSIVEGGVSSLLAVIEAASVIERGAADVILTGGSGSYAEISCLPFRGWHHLSTWQGDPSEASRPFEAGRCGVVPGEGAAVLMLESRDHAERRGAKLLARVAGFASRFEAPGDPWHERSGRAIGQSIEAALASAGMKPSDVGHVNAHGEASINQDRIEATVIREALGDVPVTAPKGAFGDLGAGSGAVELAASVLALADGRVPPTQNYDRPASDCPVNVVHGEPLRTEKRSALALNQSSTGQAAAVVLVAD